MARKITIEFDGDSRGLVRAARDAEKAVDGVGESAQEVGKQSDEAASKGERAWRRWGAAAQVAGKVAAGVAAGILATGAATISLAGNIDDLAKSARALDTSADELSRVQLALEQAGVSGATAVGALQTLERQLGRAATQGGPLADIVSDLGLSFEQLEEAAPTERLSLLIDRLGSVDDSNQRAFASSQLFRGASVEINRIIAEGEGAFAGYLDNLSNVSTITEETAAESEELTNQITLLKAEGGALIRDFLTPLIPQLVDFVNATRTGVQELARLVGVANEATGEIDRLEQREALLVERTREFNELQEELNQQLATFGADDAGVVRLAEDTEAAFLAMIEAEDLLIATREAEGVATGTTADEVERYTLRTREATQAANDAVAVSEEVKKAGEAEKQTWVELQEQIAETRGEEKRLAIEAQEKREELAQEQIRIAEMVAAEEQRLRDEADAERRRLELERVSRANAIGQSIIAQNRAITTIVEQSAKQRGLAEKEAALEAFRANKATGIINATISTALAVVNALAQVPYPANIAASVAAGVAGAAQVAVIAAQPPPSFHLGSFGAVGNSPASDEVSAVLRANERVLTPRGADTIGGDAGVRAANAGMLPTSERPLVMVYRNDIFAEAQDDLSVSRGFPPERARPGTSRPVGYTSAAAV